MKPQTKLTLGLAALCVAGWGLFYQKLTQTKFVPAERVVTQTQFVDRVVDRVVHKTVTRPDGTKIETHSEVREQSKVATTASDTTVARPPLPKNSFGAETQLPKSLKLHLPKHYDFQYGRRIGQTNLWTTTTLQVSDSLQLQTVSVGLRLDF